MKAIVINKSPAFRPVSVSRKCVSVGTMVKPTDVAIFFSVSANGSLTLKCLRSTISLSTITKLAPIPITAPALKPAKYAPTPPVVRYPEAMTPVMRRTTPMRPISRGVDAKFVMFLVHGSERS